eukprot:COSAG05_NODE_11_length_38500_cov_831.349861_46_plen_79_part_00
MRAVLDSMNGVWLCTSMSGDYAALLEAMGVSWLVLPFQRTSTRISTTVCFLTVQHLRDGTRWRWRGGSGERRCERVSV